jgi:hypothetical protein
MTRQLLLITTLLLTVFQVPAQRNSTTTARSADGFHSFNTLQLANGSSTTSFALTTVNGFQWSRFFAGAGTGFDYYFHTSIPLFVEARLDLVRRKGKIQLFGNGGLNFPFSSPNKNFETRTGDYKTGRYYGAGLDYLAPAHSQAFILGVAFSNKQDIQLVDNKVWNPVLNRLEDLPIKQDYSLNRITIRIGWMF